jgi:hypothetical protein
MSVALSTDGGDGARARSRLVVAVVAVWLLVAGAGGLVARVQGPALNERGIRLPWINMVAIDATGGRLILLGGLLAFGLAPCWLVPFDGPDSGRRGAQGDRHLRRWMRLLLLQATVFPGILWIALLVPRATRHAALGLGEIASQERLSFSAWVDEAAPWAVLLLGLAQLHALHGMARAILRGPRGSAGREAGGTLFVATVPGLALARLVAGLLDGVRPVPAVGHLLVSFPLAAGGTAFLITWGVVLALRLRALGRAEPGAPDDA